MIYELARRNMVDNQIRPNQVTREALLEALLEIPREKFVPDGWRDTAYLDGDIDLGGGHWLMRPACFARLAQEAGIRSSDVVLDVGCTTGYSSAVLGRLASTVVAVESDLDLIAKAADLLANLGVDNVAVVSGALAEGDAAHGPYDVILLEGQVPSLPKALIDQLADGGRLVAVVGESGQGRAMRLVRSGMEMFRQVLFDQSIHMLPCPVAGQHSV